MVLAEVGEHARRRTSSRRPGRAPARGWTPPSPPRARRARPSRRAAPARRAPPASCARWARTSSPTRVSTVPTSPVPRPAARRPASSEVGRRRLAVGAGDADQRAGAAPGRRRPRPRARRAPPRVVDDEHREPGGPAPVAPGRVGQDGDRAGGRGLGRRSRRRGCARRAGPRRGRRAAPARESCGDAGRPERRSAATPRRCRGRPRRAASDGERRRRGASRTAGTARRLRGQRGVEPGYGRACVPGRRDLQASRARTP